MKLEILNILTRFKISTYIVKKRRKVLNYINRYLPGKIYTIRLDTLLHNVLGYDEWIYTSETPQYNTLHCGGNAYDTYLKTYGMRVGYPAHKSNESLIKLSKTLNYLAWPNHERNHILCYAVCNGLLVVDGTHRVAILRDNVFATAKVKVISTFWLWVFLLVNSKLTKRELAKYK